MKIILCFCFIVIASILFHDITVAQTQKQVSYFSATFAYGTAFGYDEHKFLDDLGND